MFKNSSILIFILFLLASCVNNQQADSAQQNKTLATFPVEQATGFTLSAIEQGYQISVTNPWQEAQGVEYRYLLTDKNILPKDVAFDEVIKTPAKRIVCLSTTHVAFIDRLGEANRIVGVSGADYVSSELVQKRIAEKLVKDVGYEQALNYELVVSLKPDVVLAYGVGAEMAGYLQKLKDLKIPVIFIGDYLEENPLGKAEWIKVFGLLLDKYALADSIYSEVQTEYLGLKNMLPKDIVKPNVFINLPWKDIWYFTGSQGYLASLIDDAGGNYLLRHLEGNRSYPFSIENSLEYAAKADIWINPNMANSVADIIAEVPILKGFSLVSDSTIFNNNNRVSPKGGNDFFESGTVNPHLILKDLIKIFHPNQLHHDLVYYKPLR
ncbi:MAG: ABC transporter substrate-binding protein [Tenuifilaceae bacterium]|nr:ABC transporter substrate-binding protein [Tenuifilaceae bacterium]